MLTYLLVSIDRQEVCTLVADPRWSPVSSVVTTFFIDKHIIVCKIILYKVSPN